MQQPNCTKQSATPTNYEIAEVKRVQREKPSERQQHAVPETKS